MNNWLDKLERKFGRFAIPNLTIYLLGCYIVGYVISIIMPQLLNYFTLEIGLVFTGQVWRLLSWIIIPPTNSLIYMIFMLLLYYSLGNTLENAWGAFRYNLYILSGIIFTVLGAIVIFVMTGGFIGLGSIFSTYYLNLSIFLACATLMPDIQLLLYGIIPVKMKWLGYLDVALLIYSGVTGGIIIWVLIIASLLNYLLFFLSTRNTRKYSPKQVKRRVQFEQAVRTAGTDPVKGTRHKCAVCGRTELDDPTLEFRYCSKCNGNYEYCQDHLFTHTHVR